MTEDELIALEKSRLAGMVSREFAQVEALMDDEFEFFHGDGRYHRGEAFLTDVKTGGIEYHTIRMTNPRGFILGDVAVLFYDMALHVDAYGTKDIRTDRAVTSVWRKGSGGWRIVLFKGVAVSAPA